jgi:hypothetical protein
MPTVANAHLYVVHDKDGRAAGTLTRCTLASLFSGWKSTHPPSPTQTAIFNNELLALVRRRCAALRPPNDIDSSPNWSPTASPDLMRRILQASVSATNVSAHPSTGIQKSHTIGPLTPKTPYLGPTTTRSHHRSRTVPSATRTTARKKCSGHLNGR